MILQKNLVAGKVVEFSLWKAVNVGLCVAKNGGSFY